MNAFRSLLLVLLLGSTCAAAAPATESSIKQLLSITQTRRLVDSIRGQLDMLMNNAIQQALAGKTPTSKQQQAITKMKSRMGAVMQGELAWDKLEPMYVRLYKETFSQEEIAGMLSFYQTPSGQAVISKMPSLVQKSMGEMQKTVAEATPKMQKIQADFVAEMKAAGN